jgi:methionyl-tRNA formyltransferase
LVVRVAGGIAVLAGRGGLLLDEVQLAGKRAMSAAEFVRGRPEFVGSVLGAAQA